MVMVQAAASNFDDTISFSGITVTVNQKQLSEVRPQLHDTS